MELAILELDAIKKSFKEGHATHWVINGVSMRLMQGNTYAIMGPSGSGKSTLMHIIAGLDEPTHGSVLYNGKNLYHLPQESHQLFLQKKVGLLFQQPYLLSELTVLENVMLPGLITGRNKNECQNDASQLISAVGLEEKAASYPGSLSGGQQQRIALARSLINQPSFLIADEPTGNLDEKTGREILDLMLLLQKKWGMGILVSTHDHYVGTAMNTMITLKNGMLQGI